MRNKPTMVSRFLSTIERLGNGLPHPATLFASFSLAIILLSWLTSLLGLEAVNPKDGSMVEPINLVSRHGLHWILENTVHNYTGFAPLGTVLVALLGIGVAEKSGLIGTILRLLVHTAPPRLLTFVLVMAGVMSNMASDVGYVLLVPLGAIIFLSVGRHPIAGLAAAFAGVSGGFSANLLLGTIDPLVAGISQEAARIMEPTYTVTPACNYYFMVVSTFVVAAAGTWVTEKVVEPRLGVFVGDGLAGDEDVGPLNPQEKKGLVWASVVNVLFLAVVLWGLFSPDRWGVIPADGWGLIPADGWGLIPTNGWAPIPGAGFLRDPVSGDVLHSPFMHGIVTSIFLGGVLSGVAYGFGAGTFRNDTDVVAGMKQAMETMGMFLVLVFFAAQFVAYFKYTNLGMILAIKGAESLQASGLGPIPLMLLFLLLSAILNMLMGSASAKWAFMAPVFVPMFMLLGYSPELIQGVYRIGDSATNIISPMMSFFALIVAFMQRYDKKAGMGTVIATMLPYSMTFLLAWMVLLIIWLLTGLPLGPGGDLYLQG